MRKKTECVTSRQTLRFSQVFQNISFTYSLFSFRSLPYHRIFLSSSRLLFLIFTLIFLLPKNVVIPECKVQVIPRNEDGNERLECQSVSNPETSKFVWRRKNETFEGGTQVSSSSLNSSTFFYTSSSIIVIPLHDNHGDVSLLDYTCTTSNSIGSSIPCKLQAHEISGKSLLFQSPSSSPLPLPLSLLLSSSNFPLLHLSIY